MKMRAILALVAGILAVHTLVLYLFIKGGSVTTADAPVSSPVSAPSAVVSPTPEKTRVAPVSSAGNSYVDSIPNPPAIETGRIPSTSKRAVVQPSSYRNPNFCKPLNYKYAVNGLIPGIPASSLAATGILVDLNTRNVFWAKNPQKPYPIASMTKIMTLLLAYEDILNTRNGVTLDTPVKVSRKAALVRESRVYLDERETFPLRELMKATSIKSANDAAYLIAEFLGGGNADNFVERMNRRAKELGMKNSIFFNSHGLPGRNSKTDNMSSPEDMLILAEHTLEHPLLVEWASTLTADFRDPSEKGYIKMRNHNNLLEGGRTYCEGINGLKTGFINRSGFCITFTCERNGLWLAGMVTGFSTQKERDLFVRQLVNWGYERASNPSAPLKAPAPQKTHKNVASKKKTAKKK